MSQTATDTAAAAILWQASITAAQMRLMTTMAEVDDQNYPGKITREAPAWLKPNSPIMRAGLVATHGTALGVPDGLGLTATGYRFLLDNNRIEAAHFRAVFIRRGRNALIRAGLWSEDRDRGASHEYLNLKLHEPARVLPDGPNRLAASMADATHAARAAVEWFELAAHAEALLGGAK